MKKILLILFLFLSVISYSQGFPINSTFGSPKTTVLTKGVHAIDSGFWYRTNFQDTIALNLGLLNTVPGITVRVGDKIYLRSNDVIKWIEIGSGATIDSLIYATKAWRQKGDDSLGAVKWGLTGNSGTDSTINFIGTTDNRSLSFRVNNEPAGFILSDPYDITAQWGYTGTFIGQYAGETLINQYKSGSNLSLIGQNTLIGGGAGRSLGNDFGNKGTYISNQNTFIGSYAGYSTQITNGLGGQFGRNASVGTYSLTRNISGSDNSAVGTSALERNDNGDGNSAFGRDAMRSNASGSWNAAIGTLALGYNSTGIHSATITNGGSGYTTATVTFSAPYLGGAGLCTITATGTAIIDEGVITGITITEPGCGYTTSTNKFYEGRQFPVNTITITGDGIGATAIPVLASNNRNVGIGLYAGIFARMPQENVYIGNYAGYSTRFKDTGNIFIGSVADIDASIPTTININKSVAIGYNAKVGASNTIALGGTGADTVNVGINTIAARKKLDVVGSDILVHELRIGRGNNSISNNTAFGFEVLDSITTSTANVAIGYRAAKSLKTADWNVAVGNKALENLKIGGGYNVAIGGQAFNKMKSGIFSTAIGTNSFYNYTDGGLSGYGYNTGLGGYSGFNVTTGEFNTLIGANTGYKLTSGNYNIALGIAAIGGGESGTGGSVGSSSSGNIAIGVQSLAQVDTGSNNIAIGYNALRNSKGFVGRNIAIGSYAGIELIRGDYNVIIGGNTGISIVGASNQILISDGEGNQRMKLDSAGDVRIQGDIVTVNNGADTLATMDYARGFGAGATPTLQQVLTAGSTVNTDTYIDAASTDATDFYIGEPTPFKKILINSVRETVIGASNPATDWSSEIVFHDDSLMIRPGLNKLYIDSLDYTLSTTGKKILIRDTATGLVQNIDPALLADAVQGTNTLASFNAGSGAAGDTTAFSTSAIYGSFFNSGNDTLIITKIQVGLQGTSPDISPQVYYNDSLNVAATFGNMVINSAKKVFDESELVASTNIYTGTEYTTFSNYKIPPGVWVWVKSPVLTTKPTYFSLSLIGYKKRV